MIMVITTTQYVVNMRMGIESLSLNLLSTTVFATGWCLQDPIGELPGRCLS